MMTEGLVPQILAYLSRPGPRNHRHHLVYEWESQGDVGYPQVSLPGIVRSGFSDILPIRAGWILVVTGLKELKHREQAPRDIYSKESARSFRRIMFRRRRSLENPTSTTWSPNLHDQERAHPQLSWTNLSPSLAWRIPLPYTTRNQTDAGVLPTDVS